MVKDYKLDIIKLIAQPYALDILKGLKTPKRYNELKAVCKNDRTLAKRLKILQDNGLVGTTALKRSGKYMNFYKITDKGMDLLRKIESLRL